MAWTVTKTHQTVFGDRKVWMGLIAVDSGSDTVELGFGNITHVQATPKSLTSTIPNFAINATTAGVASPGTLAVTGCTSGDDLYVTVYGV